MRNRETVARIERTHAEYVKTMRAALVAALREMVSFCKEYERLPDCLREAVNRKGLKALLEAPLEGTEMRFEAEVRFATCEVKANLCSVMTRLEQDKLGWIASRFLEMVAEAGVPRAERVLTVVEAIERRVEEARDYVASAAEDLEARLKAELKSPAYSALEARAALEGLKEA